MQNTIIKRDIVQMINDRYKNELSKYTIRLAGHIFHVFSNYNDISRAILEFDEIVDEDSHHDVDIYILNVDKAFIEAVGHEANNEDIQNNVAYLSIQCERCTWMYVSNDTKTAITLSLNKGNDQWDSPLVEQLRWHLATHIMHYLEKSSIFCFHASAVRKDDRVVAIFGEPESGKSTQVARAISNGWELISDDRVAFKINTDYNNKNVVLISKFWNSIKLRGDVHGLNEIKTLLSGEKTILNSYYEENHGVSRRYIFKRRSINCDIPLTQCFILLDENTGEVNHMQLFKLLSDSLMTFGDGEYDGLKYRRKQIFLIIQAILETCTVKVINGRKENFESFLER